MSISVSWYCCTRRCARRFDCLHWVAGNRAWRLDVSLWDCPPLPCGHFVNKRGSK